jgi:hypothetical protein
MFASSETRTWFIYPEVFSWVTEFEDTDEIKCLFFSVQWKLQTELMLLCYLCAIISIFASSPRFNHKGYVQIRSSDLRYILDYLLIIFHSYEIWSSKLSRWYWHLFFLSHDLLFTTSTLKLNICIHDIPLFEKGSTKNRSELWSLFSCTRMPISWSSTFGIVFA